MVVNDLKQLIIHARNVLHRILRFFTMVNDARKQESRKKKEEYASFYFSPLEEVRVD